MVACPQCGTNNSIGVPVCTQCGAALTLSAAHAPASLNQTVLGMPSPKDGPAPAPAKGGPPVGAQTLLGMAAPGSQGAHLPAGPTTAAVPGGQPLVARFQVAPQEAKSLDALQRRSTLLGIAAPEAVPAASLSPEAGPPQNREALGRTMVGGHGAPPPKGPRAATLPGGLSNNSSEVARGAVEAGGEAQWSPTNGLVGSTAILHPGAESAPVASTMLGMSAPTPDPLHRAARAGVTAPQLGGAPYSAEVLQDPANLGPNVKPSGLPAIAPGSTSDTGELAGLHAAAVSRSRKSGLLLLGLAIALLIGVGAFIIYWDPPKPLTARVQLNENGEEFLRLKCENCPDGTTLKLRAQSAKFEGGESELRLESLLSIGSNELRIRLDRPGLGRDEEIKLNVPMHFRVSGDLAALNAASPALRVLVQAEEDSLVRVDGTTVPLRNGKGEHVLDISADVSGQAAATETIERTAKYSVTLADGSKESGDVRLSARVAPLLLEAPGPSAITQSEHFMLAGRTSAGGSVSVAGKAITVDPEGRFAQLMSVDSVGETNILVRASLPEHAPRLLRLRVKRVSSLEREGALFKAGATTGYKQVLELMGSRPSLRVALKGQVQDVRISGQRSIVLLDVSEGCEQAPCLARILIGAKKRLEKEAPLEVFGHVKGELVGPRDKELIPEILADFVLE